MNQQGIEKQITDPTGQLQVHSIFYTIQGEGPFTGHSAVFIRLAGCNLQCPACDTNYTSSRWTASVKALLLLVKESAETGLVVITGGEPFRQDIVPLCKELLSRGYQVQIESNGTLPPSNPGIFSRDLAEKGKAFIICSPKTGKINNEIARLACAFKYVVQSGDMQVDGLPIRALGHSATPWVARPPEFFTGPVYVQPLDEQDSERNQANTLAAVRSCQKHKYILQLQTHKILNME